MLWYPPKPPCHLMEFLIRKPHKATGYKFVVPLGGPTTMTPAPPPCLWEAGTGASSPSNCRKLHSQNLTTFRDENRSESPGTWAYDGVLVGGGPLDRMVSPLESAVRVLSSETYSTSCDVVSSPSARTLCWRRRGRVPVGSLDGSWANKVSLCVGEGGLSHLGYAPSRASPGHRTRLLLPTWPTQYSIRQ